MELDLHNREFLQKLREQAYKDMDAVESSTWKRAFGDLAHAANVLDAFWARCEVKED